jgi:hypothetical protein
VPRSVKSPLTSISKKLERLKSRDHKQIFYEPVHPEGYGWMTPAQDGSLAALPSRALLEAVCGEDVFRVTVREPEACALLHLASHHGWPHAALEAFCVDAEAFANDVIEQCDGKLLRNKDEAMGAVLKLLHSEGVPLAYRDPRALQRLPCGSRKYEVPAACGRLITLQEELRRAALGIQERYPALSAVAASYGQAPIGLAASHIASRMVAAVAVAIEEEQAYNFVHGTMHYDTTYFQDMLGGYRKRELPPGLLEVCAAAVKDATGVHVGVEGARVTMTCDEYCFDAVDRLPPEFEGLGLQPKGAKERQPDRPLANLLELVLGKQLAAVLRYPGAGDKWYMYGGPTSGCWVQLDATGAAAALQSHYLDWCATEQRASIPHAFLNTPTHDYLLNGHGARAVLALMKDWSVRDTKFLERLDSAITERSVLPFLNVCARVDAGGVHIVAHSPDNYLSRTNGYALVHEEGRLLYTTEAPAGVDFSVVERFWEDYWADPHKRGCAQQAVASTLLPEFKAAQKLVTIGTDRGHGNHGKSVFNKVVMDTLDIMAMPLQEQMLYEGVQLGSKNSHGANELAYRHTLYAAKDEMDGRRRLDMESIKELGSGGIKKTARPLGAPEPITYVWKALPFLFCN